MTKNRISIPKHVSDAVLKEYRHKCAMCGRHTPQLHHIDQDPSHNTQDNLIPVCPNCHLQDIHDPTSPPDPAKLRLFRRYKDPLILDSRFHPIFTRTRFLYNDTRIDRPGRFSFLANELLDFVSELSMGAFYRKKLLTHLRFPNKHYAIKLSDEGTSTNETSVTKSPELSSAAWQHAITVTETLLVELLRYQNWTAVQFTKGDRMGPGA